MLAQLQERWQRAHEKERALAWKLRCAYGETWKAPRAKRESYDTVSRRADEAMEAVFKWLDVHSPRSWRTGVPAHWVCFNLTLADALTHGPLSVVPPVAYGGMPSDAIRFAQAVA